MHLVLVSSEFPPGPGGIGTHAHQLAQRLSTRGWRVTVLTPQEYAPDIEIQCFNSAQVFEVESLPKLPSAALKALQRYTAVVRRIKRDRPDVLLATGERAVWVVSAALRGTSIPWVAVGHGSEFTVVPSWERQLVRRSFNRASAIIAVSRFTLGLIEACGIVPRRAAVITNGADETVFRRLSAIEVAETRSAFGFGSEPLLLTAGNVTDRKGQELVIRAMPGILARHPNTRYLMAGLPTQQPKLQRLAEELGVSRQVHFLGRIPGENLVRLMNAADLFVLTSRTTDTGDCEGFGIAVIEAALCGKAAVVSSGSGLSESVVDGETGICVPEGDAEAVGRAVSDVIANPHLRTKLELAAEARAMRTYTWTKVAASYEEFLLTLILAGRSVSPVTAEEVS